MIIMTIDHDDENPFIYCFSLNVVNESCSNFLSDRRIMLFCGPNQVDHDFSVWHNVGLLIQMQVKEENGKIEAKIWAKAPSFLLPIDSPRMNSGAT